METRIRMTAAAWDAIERHHRNKGPFERASVALGHNVQHGSRRVIMIDKPGIVPIQDSACARQSAGNVKVSRETVRQLMWGLAQSEYDAFLSIHDHWFSPRGTDFSVGDDHDDLVQDRYFREVFEPQLASGQFGRARQMTHASMVLDQTTAAARLVGEPAGGFRAIDTIHIIGRRLAAVAGNRPRSAMKSAATDPTLVRQGDFLSPDVQRLIAGLRVGIVGCGGVGSLLAESLMRLGAREFALFDPDGLELSNLNRWCGARVTDVGRAKAELLAGRLTEALPQVFVEPVVGDVLEVQPIGALGTCDVLFLAVDNDAARYWVNRVAAAMLVPMFDLGVRVRTSPSIDFLSRVVPVIPGITACLECTPLDLLDRVAIAERFDGITAEMRRAEGYITGQSASAPSVMGLNAHVVGAAALEFLSYCAGYQELPVPRIGYWRSGRTIVAQPDQNMPAAECPACAANLRGRGLQADIPVPRAPDVGAAQLREVFAAMAEVPGRAAGVPA